MKLLIVLMLLILVDVLFLPEAQSWFSRRRCHTPSTSRVSYNNHWDQPFTFTCSNGQAINYLYSVYSPCHKDRVFKFSCARNIAIRDSNRCWWTNWVNDMDGPIVFKCPRHGFLTGVGSYHHNGYEDRRFKFRCCYSRRYIPYHCRSSGYVNGWRNTISYRAPTYSYFVGATSHHSNHYEDRRWHFETCKVKRLRWR